MMDMSHCVSIKSKTWVKLEFPACQLAGVEQEFLAVFSNLIGKSKTHAIPIKKSCNANPKLIQWCLFLTFDN
jgi:hypothetical protein